MAAGWLVVSDAALYNLPVRAAARPRRDKQADQYALLLDGVFGPVVVLAKTYLLWLHYGGRPDLPFRTSRAYIDPRTPAQTVRDAARAARVAQLRVADLPETRGPPFTRWPVCPWPFAVEEYAGRLAVGAAAAAGGYDDAITSLRWTYSSRTRGASAEWTPTRLLDRLTGQSLVTPPEGVI